MRSSISKRAKLPYNYKKLLEEQPWVAYILFIMRQLGCLYVIVWTTINVGANNVAHDYLKEAIKNKHFPYT
jgi:hypothetical protein